MRTEGVSVRQVGADWMTEADVIHLTGGHLIGGHLTGGHLAGGHPSGGDPSGRH
jgi:hypothetical protein